MIRHAQPYPLPAGPQAAGRRHQRPGPRPVYDRSFWFCYASNALLMVAVTLLFRYADFITLLGGTERQLGSVVGIGMVVALAVRVFLGVGMDRVGPRRIWLVSLAVFIVATLAHLALTSVHSPLLYLVRILLTIGIAGAVGASLTYVSLRVPETRVAEIVGMIGTSGFVGLAIGPVLGDLLFGTEQVTRPQVDRMFLLAALAGVGALVTAAFAMRGVLRPRRPRRRYPPWLPLVRRYQPGAIMLVALAMGVGVGLPGVFVRAYTLELGITGIRTYFVVYALAAIIVRVATRRLCQRIGVPAVTLLGLILLAASMLLYLTVTTSWQLSLPAAIAGVAHALLFPAVVAGGTTSYPVRYRGLATTLVLGMFDVGNLVGQPAVGHLLHYAADWGLPKYPTMFLAVAGLLLSVAALYAWFSLGRHRQGPRRPWRSRATRQPRPSHTPAALSRGSVINRPYTP